MLSDEDKIRILSEIIKRGDTGYISRISEDELVRLIINRVGVKNWIDTLVKQGTIKNVPLRLLGKIIERYGNIEYLSHKLPVDLLISMLTKREVLISKELRYKIILILKRIPEKALKVLLDSKIVNNLSMDDFRELILGVGVKKWLYASIEIGNIGAFKKEYVVKIIREDTRVVFDLLTNIRVLKAIPKDFAKEIMSLIDKRDLLYRVTESKNCLDLLGLLLELDGGLLSNVSTEDLERVIYKASSSSVVKYFELIPVTLSHICYEKIKKHMGRDWLYRLDDELGSKNSDLAFLVGLFGILDYRVSEAKLILSSFKAEIRREDVKIIKEFIEGDRKLSADEILILIARYPQFGLWAVLERPEVLRDRIISSLAPILRQRSLKIRVLDYLLSLGSFVSMETLKHINQEIRNGKLRLEEAIALAGKAGRPYNYAVFKNIKVQEDFEKALQKLGILSASS